MTLPFGLLTQSFYAPELCARLSDSAFVRALLDVEAALARVQARLGLIPPEAAARIESAAAELAIDPALLAAGVDRDGVPTLALVAALRGAAGDAAPYVHWGATSQDIVDTATVLLLRSALSSIEADLRGLVSELAALARAHTDSVMAARTHGQQATPTSFGLKVVGWGAPFVRHARRLSELAPRLFVLAFGGAAGTLASLHPHGLALTDALAAELELAAPALPWHTQRDAFAELAGWLSLVTGSLGKLAQDVISLTHTELAELAEGEPSERGGSSSMPHKNNPMQSERVLAAARANASLLSAMHTALVQEHERGTHGWQLEWLSLLPMVHCTGGALYNARRLLAGLQVFPERMRQNLEHSHGLVLSEAAVTALSGHLPRPEAFALVRRAARLAEREGRHLVSALRDLMEGDSAEGGRDLAPALHAIDWSALADPKNHLGHARELIDRALAELERSLDQRPP